jgi:beta-phosphoglucomutase-like phosphatase (HAD superfamily)
LACKERGLRVVLASSADEREFAVLRAALDAEDAIDAATSSADVERSKPAADLVQVALDRASVSATEAVFVSDRLGRPGVREGGRPLHRPAEWRYQPG